MAYQPVSRFRVLCTIVLFCAILGGVGWLATGGGGKLASLKLGFVVDTAKPKAGGDAPLSVQSTGSLQAQAAAFANAPLPGDLATCIRMEVAQEFTAQKTATCTRAINPFAFSAPPAIAALPAVQDYVKALRLAAESGAGYMSEILAEPADTVYHPVSYYQQVLRSL